MEIAYLVLIGFVAGVVNVLAGGGSTLTLPVLIFMGLPPAMANGTNRVGVFLNTIFGVFGFKSKGVTVVKEGFYWGLSATVGSIIGAMWAVDIKGDTFNNILGFVIVFVVFATVFKTKNKAEVIERLRGKYFWLSFVAFFFIGIFGGFIQAGTGFFILLVLTNINQLSLIKSNAIKLLIVAVYTVAALAIFVYYKQVNWHYGLFLAAGQSLGAWLGSRWAVKKDDVWIRGFLIVVSLGMAVKLWFFS